MSAIKTIVLALVIIFASGLTAAASDGMVENKPLVTNIFQAGLLDDGKLLCLSFDSAFSLLDLATGESKPWLMTWSPQQAGWDTQGGAGFGWKMAVSPDGKHVALATGVGETYTDADGDLTNYAIAIVLCGPDGSDARCVALAEVTDGGPPLDFTQDSSRLVGPWLFPCEATPQGYRSYIDSNYEAPESAHCNYIDTATGERRFDPGQADFEFYDKAGASDYFVYQGLDEPGYMFGSFSQVDEDTARIDDTINPWRYYEWVLPDALLVTLENGGQQLVYVDGQVQAAPDPVWRCYATLPDGTCMFDNDNGKGVKYGKVDWPTFTADWWVDRPDLAGFAEPRGEDGWPVRLNKWIPLHDSSGVVIITPDTGDVVFAKLSREGAKP